MLEEDEFSDGELDEENEMVPQLCILYKRLLYISGFYSPTASTVFSRKWGVSPKFSDVSLTTIWPINFFNWLS